MTVTILSLCLHHKADLHQRTCAKLRFFRYLQQIFYIIQVFLPLNLLI